MSQEVKINVPFTVNGLCYNLLINGIVLGVKKTPTDPITSRDVRDIIFPRVLRLLSSLACMPCGRFMSHGMPRELGMEPAVGGHEFFDFRVVAAGCQKPTRKKTNKHLLDFGIMILIL